MKETQIRGKTFVLEEHSNNETGKRNGSFGVFFPLRVSQHTLGLPGFPALWVKGDTTDHTTGPRQAPETPMTRRGDFSPRFQSPVTHQCLPSSNPSH